MLDVPVKLESDRLVLRKFEARDAEAIFRSYASKVNCTKYVSWPRHNNVEDTREYLNFAAKAWAGGTDYSYAIIEKQTDTLIGGTGFVNEGGRAYIGYILSDTAWGNGYATEATKTLVLWLLSQPGLYRIWAACDADHNASAKVLEKAGFVEEGLIRKWCIFPNQRNQAKDCLFYSFPIS